LYRKAVPSHWTRSNGQGAFNAKGIKMGHTFMIPSVNTAPSDVLYTLEAAGGLPHGMGRYSTLE
jgi:hypothetical protein